MTNQTAPATGTPSVSPSGTKPPEPKALFYILSFMIGLVGIILGIMYLGKEGPENKKFGKICLILGILPIVISILIVIATIGLGIIAAMFGGASTTSTYTY